MIWFISDTHFGHANIIKYCERPFKDVQDMDESMIKNWNSVVGADDVIYHLGDFCLGDDVAFKDYISRLNGQIKILNNPTHHDKRWIKHLPVVYSKTGSQVEYISPLFDISKKDYHIVLCHFPMYTWNKKHYLSYHLYGHVHKQNFEIPNSPLSLNVGVDMIDFYPIELETVKTIMRNRIMEYNLKPLRNFD